MAHGLQESDLIWWESRWWQEESYARLFQGKLSMAEVDAKIMNVSRVFNVPWGKKVGLHPVHYWLLSKGTEPLQFLLGLGHDLEAVQTCIGHKKLIQGLRNPQEYASALLELTIGAMLTGSGYQVQFRPKIPNGKEADILCCKDNESVFIEVKKIRESDAKLAASEFSSRLFHELINLTCMPDGKLAGY